MDCDARGSELRGFGDDLRKLGLLRYSTRGATGPAGTVHAQVVAAARVGGVPATPAAGLRPRPAREKGFPSNLFLDLIDTSPLFK
jgi:hypothetical protein